MCCAASDCHTTHHWLSGSGLAQTSGRGRLVEDFAASWGNTPALHMVCSLLFPPDVKDIAYVINYDM